VEALHLETVRSCHDFVYGTEGQRHPRQRATLSSGLLLPCLIASANLEFFVLLGLQTGAQQM
jgi:hypothetical protein